MLRSLLFAIMVVLIVGSPDGFGRASAQDAPVPKEFFDSRRQTGDKIRYCLNMSSALVEFDRAIGQEIAQALFLEPQFFEVVVPSTPYPLDYRLDMTDEDLFIFMNKRCDAFLGFSISPDDIPEWVTMTRPYHSTKFKLAFVQKGQMRLIDLAPASPVGAVMGSSADAALRIWLSNPNSKTLRRLPYPDNQLLIERLRDGTLSGALIWEPAAYIATHGKPEAEGLFLFADVPFALGSVDFGVAIRTNELFLRTQLDMAIDSLISDGTIERLRSRFGLPPDPAK